MFRRSRLFHVTTEIKGMISFLRCPRMATSKAEALLEWRNASRDEEVRATRTTAFRNMVSLLGILVTPVFIIGLFVEDIDIPKWRGRECWLVVAFQNKLVFIGGSDSGCNHLSSRVDSMDPLTSRVSSLSDLINACQRPACVATENEIFVFTDSR
ncbi:unnamed protein product [Hymenolepis diminuta]|uniref:Uncharacterized protein n=1 Tax=Hymenolepis diminuta TaxID=6216 RepID=A0A564YZI6_HYMDI|nr:unnamed protein product [Hymenolepis diminuta]